MNITIPVNRLGQLTALVERLNRKRIRLGLDALTYATSEAYEEKQRVHVGDGSYTRQIEVIDVECDSLRIMDGWQFIASIEALDNESILHCAPGIDLRAIPARFEKPTTHECDHCGHKRRRRRSYVIMRGKNFKREFKQVGSTCIKDFLGVSPSAMEFCEQIQIDIRDLEFEATATCSRREVLNVAETLAQSARVIDSFGFISKRQAEIDYSAPTSCIVTEVLRMTKKIDGLAPLEERHWEEARKTIEFFAAKKDRSNDYEYKLGQICRSELIGRKNLSILVSAIAAWRRHTEAKENAARNESKHVGALGERHRDLPVTFLRDRTLPDYGFGETAIFTFEDSEGNLLCWKTGNWNAGDFDKGEKMFLTGTVKEHREWKGIKTTSMTRCKLDRPKYRKETVTK